MQSCNQQWEQDSQEDIGHHRQTHGVLRQFHNAAMGKGEQARTSDLHVQHDQQYEAALRMHP